MSAAPLPLLGTFHELSVAVPDVRASIEFYERLGFTQASTTDTFTHPYGVLTDGRLVIGLHQRPGPSPVLTFVRAGIAAAVTDFADAGIELTVRRTGDEEFNEVGFTDPAGHAVAVIEARTYSPVARAETEVSLCGDFAEISLPAGDFAAQQAFWEPLGFVAAEEAATPYPHLALTSDHLDISFHRPRLQLQPLVVFREPRMASRVERLRAQGFALTSAFPGAQDAASFLESPDGTLLLLVSGDE
jgi:catechol 2,3-dioxygenase-like lactoylglutathione lyase family enzyme